jgi:hypothetical protein
LAGVNVEHSISLIFLLSVSQGNLCTFKPNPE